MDNRLKEIREKLGMSQEELSVKSGVARTIISRIETGKDINIQINTVKKIADAVGENASDIFIL